MRMLLNDFSLAYEDHGQGRPIVFIHGFPLNKKMWEPQLQGLANEARLLAPDLRGHGETEAVHGTYSMDLLAGDCLAFLKKAGVEGPFVICGLSMGGYIAMAFYRRYPEQVAGLILAATRAGADSPEGQANRERAAETARKEGSSPIVASMLPKMMSPKTYERRPDLVEQVKQIMEKTSVEGIIGAQLGMKDRPDSSPVLREMQVPVLILHGADDQIIPPSEAQAMQAAILDSRLHILSESGHLLNMEQPALFNQTVRGFLASIG